MKAKIELFTTDYQLWEEKIKQARNGSLSVCEIEVLNINNPEALNKAEKYGIKSVPSLVIDGKPIDCSEGINLGKIKALMFGFDLLHGVLWMLTFLDSEMSFSDTVLNFC